MNFENALNKASKFLDRNNIITSTLDSEILMSKAINKNREFIITNLNKKIDNNTLKYFNNLILQRSYGKPISYLIGVKEFWKFQFKITNDVLIPRPDTEIIIEEVLKISKYRNKLKILDIGVGSGCILLTILKEKKILRYWC